MLKIKTKIGHSATHGTGLFADQFIPKGTITWQYDPEFDMGFTEKAVSKLPPLRRDYILHYAYLDKDLNKLILCADNQKYINHSFKNINIQSTPRKDVASRDISEGEELLCNYKDFDDTYFQRLGIDENTLIG